MKRFIIFIYAIALTMIATAHTLFVKVGDVTYQFPDEQAGEMNYINGTSLTIMGKSFNLSEISSMYVYDKYITDNLVSIEYSTSGNASSQWLAMWLNM